MATLIGAYNVSLRDARGQVGRVGGYVAYADTSAATRGDGAVKALGIIGDMVALSNAAAFRYGGLPAEEFLPNAYGTTSDFQNVEDKAVLTFLAADGTLHRFSIPAPLDNIWQSDQETVDQTNTLVSNLITSLTVASGGGSAAVNRSGRIFIEMVAGARARRRFQRKTTIWTLTPDETNPEE